MNACVKRERKAGGREWRRKEEREANSNSVIGVEGVESGEEGCEREGRCDLLRPQVNSVQQTNSEGELENESKTRKKR